ncbi:hypothetical protein Micbo1qcDRAFT_200427 [Microdochium bolleyi]|uniref:Uncharacterized protein n=1 Tax=Microdochium bolleyi TaxID=196109 RepID=A0A136JCU1_9PEZI|nr:hypothetical protein Micbo1qcDRAFT_200427 [Microdochium bolleyi]
MAVTSTFPEWRKPWTPFDAIGFAHISRRAPSQEDFSRAVRYGQYMTDTGRVEEAGSSAHGLPYTSAQVQEAIDHLTNRIGLVDPEVWEWTFEDMIVNRNEYQYLRTWAPETRRWGHCILEKPIVVDLTPLTESEDDRTPCETSTEFGVASKQDSVSPSNVDSSPHRLSPDLATPQLSASGRQGSHGCRPQGSLRRVSVREALRDSTCSSSTVPTPRDSPIPTKSPSPELEKIVSNGTRRNVDDSDYEEARGSCKKRMTSAKEIAARSKAAGQSARVFLGFHREQLRHLSPSERTRDRDYRQPVQGFLDRNKRPQRKLSRLNLAGRRIPDEHCLRGSHVAGARHEDTLYHGEYIGLDHNAVQSKIIATCSEQDGPIPKMPDWVPTVPSRPLESRTVDTADRE